MADIEITRSHSLGLDSGRTAVEQVAQNLEDELGVNYHWDDGTLRFEGQGADGHIEIDPDVIRVAINLSLFLQPMRERVEAEAEDYLDRHLQS